MAFVPRACGRVCEYSYCVAGVKTKSPVGFAQVSLPNESAARDENLTYFRALWT